MPKTEKVHKVEELAERIRGSEALFVTDYRGLSVADITELRRALRDSGARLTVAKNTLLRLAAGEAGVAGLDDLLQGPTAVAFVEGDPINAAKGLVEAGRRFRTLEIRGGYMEGKVMSSAEAQFLATIEPREVLLAKIAGVMKGEMSRAAYMFQALQSRFLSVLEALRDKLPTGVAPPAAEETPAEEPPAGEPPVTAEPAPAAEAATQEASPTAIEEPAAAEETTTQEAPPTEEPAPAETATGEAPAAEEPTAPATGETAAEEVPAAEESAPEAVVPEEVPDEEAPTTQTDEPADTAGAEGKE
jgi:large subunit ribosomal protein L10